MTCEQCGKPMTNLGNVSGIVMTSWPVQWNDIWVCHDCKTRKSVRVSGSLPEDNSYVFNYTQV